MTSRMLPLGAALIALGLAASTIASAADNQPIEPGPWGFDATVGLNLSQSSFSNNWAGGDNGSIVWVLNSSFDAERQFTRSFNLSNQLKLAYGQTSSQEADPADSGRRIWTSPDKTTDLISFESIGRFSLHSYVDPYLALKLESQFRDQSNPIGVIPLNPIKLKESAGVARVLQKAGDREAITRLGFGVRQTFARSFVDSVSLEKESFTAVDGGIEWQTTVKRPVLEKKVLYQATLLVFQPLFYSKSDALKQFDSDFPTHEPVADFWKTTDISFQNAFSAQITKVLSVNLFVQFVYDKFDVAANVDSTLPDEIRLAEIDRNVRKAGQFKETLALGLTYQLF